MGTKTVTKALAGVEDCLMGSEVRTQVRAGQNVQVTGLSGAGIPLNAALGGSIEEAISSITGETDNLEASVTALEARSNRNYIINGNFQIWQRGTSTSQSDGYHAADRWANREFGGSFTASRQAHTLGQVVVPGNPQYFMRTDVSAGADQNGFCLLGQAIPAATSAGGSTVTLSFWAKADTPVTIATEYEQVFDDSATPPPVEGIGITKHNLTTTWQKYFCTVLIPTIDSGLVYNNKNSYLGLYIWLSAGTTYDGRTGGIGLQSGVIDISQIQVEVGEVVTDFETEYESTTLVKCQHFFQRGTVLLGGYTEAGILNGYRQSLPINTRTLPEIQNIVNVKADNVTGGTVTTNLSDSVVMQATGVASGVYLSEITFDVYAELGPVPHPNP